MMRRRNIVSQPLGTVKESIILPLIVFLATMLFGIPASDAKIYKWVDENGTVHFSDNPLRGSQKFQKYQFEKRSVQPKKKVKRRDISRPVPPPAGVLRGAKWKQVAKVIDGDTIRLTTGEKVRFLGIDAPETKHPKKVPDPCGPAASKYNRDLLAGQEVVLEFDVEREDRYGRLLAHVFTRSTFVNAELVRRGYARVSTYRPNLKYRDFFLSLQSQAKKNDRGLWGEC
jgi:endonuclease YncB( thermonuclease family)